MSTVKTLKSKPVPQRNPGSPAKSKSPSTFLDSEFRGSQYLGSQYDGYLCQAPHCKIEFDSGRHPAVECRDCKAITCLKHRLNHECPGPGINRQRRRLQRAKDGAETTTTTTTNNSSPQKSELSSSARQALARLRQWNPLRQQHPASTSSAKNTPPASSSKRMTLAQLRMKAVGESITPLNNRIYVLVEDQTSGSSSSNVVQKPMYFDKNWAAGRALDKAAIHVDVQNLNSSRPENDPQRLWLYHVQQGRCLTLGGKLEDFNIKNGDTLALIRGLQSPDLISV